MADSGVSNDVSPNSCKATTGGPTSTASAAPNGQSGSPDRSTKKHLEHRCSDHSSDTDCDTGRVDAQSCAIVPAKVKAKRALWMQLMAWKEEPIPQACTHIYRRVRDMGAVYWYWLCVECQMEHVWLDQPAFTCTHYSHRPLQPQAVHNHAAAGHCSHRPLQPQAFAHWWSL